MSLFSSDIWKIGVIEAPLVEIVKKGSLVPFPVHWLPEAGSFRFLADPFGFWHQGTLYCFAEYYDYRTAKGEIRCFVLDRNFHIIEQRTVLTEDWHLSYPQIIEDNGEIYMLPEGYKSGKLTLYRAKKFPWEWEIVPEFSFPQAAIDATPIKIEGQWWMFYAPPAPAEARTGALMVACADKFLGPWRELMSHPIHVGKGHSRMGGTILPLGDQLFLPTQNCLKTYGGSLQFIRTTLPLTPDSSFFDDIHITSPEAYQPFTDGVHTLSAAGNVTFIDAKYISHNFLYRGLIDIKRKCFRPH